MKLVQSVRTVTKTTGMSLLLLTVAARPSLTHGSESHPQTPTTPAANTARDRGAGEAGEAGEAEITFRAYPSRIAPASTSHTAEQEQQSQKVEPPVQWHTPKEPMPTTAPDEYSMTSPASTLMPTGLGESIFVLLIGTPLGLFFWKQRR